MLSARKTFIFSSHFYAAINSTQPANKGWNQMTNIFNNLQLDWVMPRCLLSSGSARWWQRGWWRSATRRRGHFNDNFTPTTRPTAPFLSKLLCLWKGVGGGGSHLHCGSTSLDPLINRVCSGVAHRWTQPGGNLPHPPLLTPGLFRILQTYHWWHAARRLSVDCSMGCTNSSRSLFSLSIRWSMSQSAELDMKW